MRPAKRLVDLCAVLALVAVAVPTGRAADGGSGTYTANGRTYYFALFNNGTTTWQFFSLVGPPGTVFVGGATVTGESTARCVLAQPDGTADEIECGPLSPTAAPSTAHFTFVAVLSAPVACGAPFRLEVSSTGTRPYASVGDVTYAGSCTAVKPAAVTRPAIHGTPAVGGALKASAPTWSAPPTRVAYQWQLCSAATCSAIKGATRLTLRLDKRDAGRAVRIVATATVDGVTVTSASKTVVVRG